MTKTTMLWQPDDGKMMMVIMTLSFWSWNVCKMEMMTIMMMWRLSRSKKRVQPGIKTSKKRRQRRWRSSGRRWRGERKRFKRMKDEDDELHHLRHHTSRSYTRTEWETTILLVEQQYQARKIIIFQEMGEDEIVVRRIYWFSSRIINKMMMLVIAIILLCDAWESWRRRWWWWRRKVPEWMDQIENTADFIVSTPNIINCIVMNSFS